MSSLRRRLLVSLTATILLATVLQAGWQYWHALRQSDASFDYHLRQLALALRDQVLAAPGAGATVLHVERDVVVQVWNADGARSYRSHGRDDLPPASPPGYVDVEAGGTRWRVYTTSAGSRSIQAAQPHRLREAAAARAALHAVTGPILLAAVLTLMAWLVVTASLRPVARVAATVAAREPGDLRPLPARGVPDEVRPLVTAVDALLARLAAAQRAQQQLIADAAHALRTPLTALSLQLQHLGESDDRTDPATRASLAAGVGRATRLVEQLLALARSESSGEALAEQEVALDELARHAIAAALPLADERGADLGLSRGEPVRVRGDPDLLGTVLANLLDNALRYGGAGVRVDVSAYAEGGRAVLEVADSGPGIPAERRDAVLERFRRLPESAAGGTGLGLAIVRAAVARHGGDLSLGTAPHGGLQVRISLPRVA